MRFHERAGAIVNTVSLAAAARSIDKDKRETAAQFNALALATAQQVEAHKLDPLAGEAAISSAEETLTTPGLFTDRAEKAATALERLVTRGVLDPIVAEEVLNYDFAVDVVVRAIDKINKPKSL